MMCLGWDNNPICQPPDQVTVVAPCPSPVAAAAGILCPDISWFWIAAGLVGAGAVMKGANRK